MAGCQLNIKSEWAASLRERLLNYAKYVSRWRQDLVGWLVEIYGISALVSYLIPNPVHTVILRTGGVVESARSHRLSSIRENVTNLARAGRMTCKVRRGFKIITHELSRVLRQFHWWHRTFWDLRFVLQNLYIRKQVRRLKAGFTKQVRQRSRRTQPVPPSLLRPNCPERVNSQLSPTPAPPPRRRERKNITKRTFRAATIVVRWIKNDYYFSLLKFRVWVFLFLRTPFFKT